MKIREFKRNDIWSFILNMDSSILKNSGILSFKFIKNILTKGSDFKKYVILQNNKIIGGINVIKNSDTTRRIGIIIFKKYRNRGIATEASKKIIYYIKKSKINKIYAETLKNNLSAIMILKKLKFKTVKETKKEFFWEKTL